MTEETKKSVTPVTLPRPDMFLCLYAYEPSAGSWLWQTGQLVESEEEAIAYGLTMGNAHAIRIVRIPGLEKFYTPDTLKMLHRSAGEVVAYTDDPKVVEEDEQDSPN